MARKTHGATFGMLGLLVAFATPVANSDYGEPVELATPISEASQSRCNIMCWNCENGQHYDRGTGVPEYQWRAQFIHPSAPCGASSTCQGAGHTEACEIGGRGGMAFANTQENYDALRTMIVAGELQAMTTALDTDWVSYVAERQSIQVQSCAGIIIANFPVPPEWAMVIGRSVDLAEVTTP